MFNNNDNLNKKKYKNKKEILLLKTDPRVTKLQRARNEMKKKGIVGKHKHKLSLCMVIY